MLRLAKKKRLTSQAVQQTGPENQTSAPPALVVLLRLASMLYAFNWKSKKCVFADGRF
jgi:hypothetical protein